MHDTGWEQLKFQVSTQEYCYVWLTHGPIKHPAAVCVRRFSLPVDGTFYDRLNVMLLAVNGVTIDAALVRTADEMQAWNARLDAVIKEVDVRAHWKI